MSAIRGHLQHYQASESKIWKGGVCLSRVDVENSVVMGGVIFRFTK